MCLDNYRDYKTDQPKPKGAIASLCGLRFRFLSLNTRRSENSLYPCELPKSVTLIQRREKKINMSIFSSLYFTLWLTGLSCSGKSTIAIEIAKALEKLTIPYELLDADIIRTNISKELGFSREDRITKVLRVGFVCNRLNQHGINAIVAMISPYRETREKLRLCLPNYIEVYLDTPLEVCRKRLYKKAFSNEIPEFTAISLPYEIPEKPDLTLRTHEENIEQCVERVLEYLHSRGFIAKN